MGTLTSKQRKRVAVVGVLSLLFYLIEGLYFHDVLRSMIGGVITIALVLFVNGLFFGKKSDEKSKNE